MNLLQRWFLRLQRCIIEPIEMLYIIQHNIMKNEVLKEILARCAYARYYNAFIFILCDVL